jgi:hypothetical protein
MAEQLAKQGVFHAEEFLAWLEIWWSDLNYQRVIWYLQTFLRLAGLLIDMLKILLISSKFSD